MNPCGTTEATTETGDTWHLSQHLLVCADLTDLDTALKLLQGEQPKVIIESDPVKCDAIVEAWQKLSGFSATIHGYHHLYDQVRRMRAGNSALSCRKLSRKEQKELEEAEAQAGRPRQPHRQAGTCGGTA